MKLINADCLEALRTLPDNSIDSIVTDPPYGLSFMGKKWDYDVPSEDIWRECLRVLKPGGHLLSFAGTRTQHHMAVRIEDAGFEIRDMIAWVYGSGFPKSLDISKAIDKRGGNSHLTKEVGAAIKASRMAHGVTISEADKRYCGSSTLWTWYEGRPAGQQMPTADIMAHIASDWPELQKYADAIAEAEREVTGQKDGNLLAVAPGQDNDRSATTLDITAPATEAAKQWEGWGTALKPALEPITVARKPLIGTVAENVLTHGTGGLNIDGCRVGYTSDSDKDNAKNGGGQAGGWAFRSEVPQRPHSDLGRFPANLIHDGSEEVLGLFPNSSGGAFPKKINGTSPIAFRGDEARESRIEMKDSGSAARFFYAAKASKSERTWFGVNNNHPTVKPISLMRYLCRLVTPPGGVVLDPFMGSGTTGIAAKLEGFDFIGIEREAEYLKIAQERINSLEPEPETETLM